MFRNRDSRTLANGSDDAFTDDAFTLVELLIVVVILGLLAAIVVPTAHSVTEESERSRFVGDLQSFVSAAEVFKLKTGDHLPDGGSGNIPPGFDTFVRLKDWESGTPVGGVWDTEKDSFGVTSALGVHFMGVTPKPDEYMLEVDKLLDDGNLGQGAFRKLAGDRFYYVLKQ